jgi:uncharacterized protein YndB with AHSA1/START domain
MKVTHDTFTIERVFDATPERVFAALGDPEKKAKWFVGPNGWKLAERSFDFRVGGRERVVGTFPDGKTSAFDATYYDIVPNERIVFAYLMHVNGERFSVSLSTFEISKHDRGAKLVLTEQGVFFGDANDAKGRVEGTHYLLDQLGASLAS